MASSGWTYVGRRAVVRLKPVFGYLHRNHEKIAENNAYLAAIPYTDRSTTSVR